MENIIDIGIPKDVHPDNIDFMRKTLNELNINSKFVVGHFLSPNCNTLRVYMPGHYRPFDIATIGTTLGILMREESLIK